MRATRWSIWLTAPFMPGHIPPAMIVMRAQDMTMPPEEVGRPDGVPGLIIHDTWEMPDGELEAAIAEAMMRADKREEAETHMATLYFWTAAWLTRMKEGAPIMTEKPNPLTRDDLVTVLQQLADHPDYNHHQVITLSGIDGTLVHLKTDGLVSINHNPRGASQ